MKKTAKTIVRAISVTLALVFIAAAFTGCTRVFNSKLIGQWERTNDDVNYQFSIEKNGNFNFVEYYEDYFYSYEDQYPGTCFAIGKLLFVEYTDYSEKKYKEVYTVNQVNDSILILKHKHGDKFLLGTDETTYFNSAYTNK